MIRFPAIGSVIAVRVLAVIALVIFLSQLAIVMVFWHMAQRQAGAEYRLPLPARVASIVEIVEATAPEDRTTLLQAMNGPDLAVRIVPELTETERLGRRRIPVFRRAVEGYSEILQDREVIGMIGLGNHDFTELRQSDEAVEAGFPMRLLIDLKADGWLVIETPDLLGVRIRRLPFGFVAGLSGTIVVALAVWAIWQEVRPVRDMAKAARSFAQTGKPSLVKPAGGSDLRALTRSFNKMQTRISELIANRALVMSAMTHDVRTYLTRLRLRIEALEPASREAAERTLSDIQELLDDTLAFAEDGAPRVGHESVNLARMLEDISASGQFPEDRIHLQVSSGLFTEGHPSRLQRAFVNLIANAIKYGQSADISLERCANSACIVISDRGPGIAPADRKHVFEPFFRRETSRNRKTEGAGLGLAIAHTIITSHKGSITLLARPGGGLRVVVRLPATQTGHALI